MANTEIARIESLVQSAEAYGAELHKADECTEGIMGIREERNETAGSLREVLSRVEAETTPRVLEMARRVFSGYGDDKFKLYIHMHDEAKTGIPKLSPYDFVDIFGNNGLVTIKAVNCSPGAYMTAIISPSSTSNVRRKLMGIIPLKKGVIDPSVKLNYSQRCEYDFLSENNLSPDKIFKLIADRYSAQGEKSSYLDTYVEMYAKLPQLIARIGEGLKKQEQAKRSELEKSLEKADKLAEGTQ